MRLHVSFTSKLGKAIPSISLPAGETCRPDAPCLDKCYARKGNFHLPSVKDALADNLAYWNESHAAFEMSVNDFVCLYRFIRWHASGDIPDGEYLKMMVRVAKQNPRTDFLCFTKKYELVNEYLEHNPFPENLHMALSTWGNFKPENPHSLPLAMIKFRSRKNDIPEDAIACPGFCETCCREGGSCWELAPGQVVYFDEH